MIIRQHSCISKWYPFVICSANRARIVPIMFRKVKAVPFLLQSFTKKKAMISRFLSWNQNFFDVKLLLMSDKVVDRDFVEKWQVLWTSSSVVGFSFRPHPIRQIPSLLHRDILTNRHPSGRHQLSASPWNYGTFWTFQCLSLGCITRRKGIKKASCRNGTRLFVLLCFLGCQTLIRVW